MDKLALLDTGFEGYSPDYVTHNLPFLVLSGLESTSGHDDFKVPERYRDGAIQVTSESPLITGPRAEHLVDSFRKYEKNDDEWSNRPVVEGSSVTGFHIKIVGRDYELPPRKAKPPLQESTHETPGSPSAKLPHHWVLHSPMSPLSPGSPIYPDGVMTPDWVGKHQQYVPSAFVSFFDFKSDSTRNSLMDNQLKTEINNIKATIYRSEFKTKLVVVLLSDKTIQESPEIEERLTNIRRATALDPKTGFFFLPPNVSAVEVTSFVDSVLTALLPGCVEYYRDLTKHARRKKNRGNIPAPTMPPTRGTSQTLAAIGWAIRYDFKLGVFAEFRQEMESACRHYTAALESLLGPDGIFETTASWSPRWEESRLLADMVAMRILRCLLWSNMTTTAVQSWSNYRFRLRELIDRRGKGSANYGWEAWESRWSRMMAELVRRARLSVFSLEDGAELKIWAPVEKAIPVGERIRPFDHLHHPGYWFRMAAKHSRRRRRFAQDLPEEDCTPPGQSPASAMASRYGTYDTYLCPEPWQEHPIAGRQTYNHAEDIFNALDKSSGSLRAQPRAFDENTLEIAKEFVRNKQYDKAMEALFYLWGRMSWRRDKWWDLVFEVTRNLRECARQMGDSKVLAAAEFELHSNALPVMKNQTYDLSHCGQSLQRNERPSWITGEVVELNDSKVVSFISSSFTFSLSEGNAGEPLKAQLVINSQAQRGSAPVRIANIRIELTGSPLGIDIKHSESLPVKKLDIQSLTLHEASSRSNALPILTTEAFLELGEGEDIILEFLLTFREAGPVAVNSIQLRIPTAATTILFTSTPDDSEKRPVWWKSGENGLIKSITPRQEGHAVRILPRPPKMDLRLSNITSHFYTDEEVSLIIDVTNNEDEPTDSALEIRVLTTDRPVDFVWTSSGAEESHNDLPGHQIGQLIPGASKSSSIAFTAPSLPTSYVVEVKVLYHLLSDPETPVSKIFSADLNITRAFEANYDFQPRVHPEPWPTFFSPATVTSEHETEARGIIQRWELLSRIASFTYEGILVSSVSLRQESISSNAIATLTPLDHLEEEQETEVAPQQQIDRSFTVDLQKHSLEDRRAVEVELVLAITWHRPSRADKKFTSLLPVNNFVLENGPRVLASVSHPRLPPLEEEGDENVGDARFAMLTYTLENPTNHFLTFELQMEGPNREEWAFSGMKLRSLNLLPLSRESVSYRIIPLMDSAGLAGSVGSVEAGEDGRWVEVRFRVMDVYFRKVLRVLPAGGGVREVEGKGGSLLVWTGKPGGGGKDEGSV